MRIEFLMSKLFGYSTQTYFNWKKEMDKRPILLLIEKYFSKEELETFLRTNKIEKLELIKNYSLEELGDKLNNQYNEDYMIKNLTFKFLMFNREVSLLLLRNILKEIEQPILEKNDLLKLIQNHQSNLIKLEVKKNTIFFIDKLLTDDEVKLLLKYKNKILFSFSNIEDTEID
ncbi:hypothetical protein O8C74_07370 [Aliarcobacter butzleri]|uniref:hypothetical protein n=1 Tax=Aliarcobacter butzleri TaxID=28197 RepID=UPI0006594450|nr:hypothetical protein [Aliarcobacter butzleri]KLE04230.1 hypothetical protein AF78_09085 [Aliarcobacter butzleri L353]MDN5086886.1 hypothetical protein [Aliarcobacter butzleri]